MASYERPCFILNHDYAAMKTSGAVSQIAVEVRTVHTSDPILSIGREELCGMRLHRMYMLQVLLSPMSMSVQQVSPS